MENNEKTFGKLLKSKHKGNLTTLLKIYNSSGAIFNGSLVIVSFFLSLTISVLSYKTESSYELIIFTTDIIFSILPSLLGFNLGAYALLIGLSSTEVISKLSFTNEKTKYTPFQRASSVFGFCVIIQAVGLLVGIAFKGILKLDDLFYISNTIKNDNFLNILNSFALFIELFIGLYSIVIILKVILNIFALSQASSFFAITELHKQQEEKDSKK